MPVTQSRDAPAKEPSAAQKYFTDVNLVDQDGRTLRFYSDCSKARR